MKRPLAPFRLIKPIITAGLLLFLVPQALFAQLPTLQIVGKPKKSADEIVGRKDANGRFCAAIQVISDMEGFKYDAYNGVVGDVDDKPGMDIVYLQPDERVLEIYHTGYEPLKIILSEIGIQLKEKAVWRIKISGEKKLADIPIVIITQPEDAEIFIDKKSVGSAEQHTVTEGSHQVRIVKDGYQPILETIYVDKKNVLFKYTLKEIEYVDLEIRTDPDSAEVYIDDVKVGAVTPVSDFYPAGRYPIRIEREWYVPYEDYIDIKAPKTKKAYTLQPDFGQITVTSAPQSNLEISLNGIGQNVRTPHTFERLRPGTYTVSARSEYYETEEREIQLKRGEKREVTLTTVESFATLTINTHENATVYLNGNPIRERKNLRLQPMRATVEVRMPKAEPLTRRLILKKGDRKVLDLYPEVQTGTVLVVVTPLDAHVELKGDAGEYYTSEGKGYFKDVPIGTYRLTVTRDGYEPQTESFTLRAAQTVKRTVVLEERRRPQVIAPSRLTGNTITVTLPGGATMEMVWIPPGTFTMGSPSSESGRDDDEGPQHQVTITKGFYLGKYELTQEQWTSVMGTRPWSGKSYVRENASNPAVYISWNDVQAFIAKLNQAEGSEVYRLPTEAEWEVACRAGTTTRWSFGDDESQLGEYAWYRDNAWSVGEQYAHAVGTKRPNPWGLYDMHGNVWEWVQDWYGSYSSSPQTDPTGPASGSSRVLRGGSFLNHARDVRSANRDHDSPGRRDYDVGARLLRQGQ